MSYVLYVKVLDFVLILKVILKVFPVELLEQYEIPQSPIIFRRHEIRKESGRCFRKLQTYMYENI